MIEFTREQKKELLMREVELTHRIDALKEAVMLNSLELERARTEFSRIQTYLLDVRRRE